MAWRGEFLGKSILQANVPVPEWVDRAWLWLRGFVAIPAVPRVPVLLALPILLVLAISRSLDTIQAPQFYAEDGTVFFADAYNLGVASLWEPYAGYLHVIPRILALVFSSWPAQAEGLFLFSTLAIQVAVAAFFFSERLRMPNNLRVIGALMVVAHPNTWEVPLHLAYVQWYLVIYAALALTARPAESRAGRLAEAVLLGLIALSSPVMLVLLPLAWLRGERTGRFRDRALLWAIGGLLAINLAAGWAGSTRPDPTGPREPGRLAAILIQQVANGSVHGLTGVERMVRAKPLDWLAVALVVAVLAAGLRSASGPVRSLLGLGVGVLVIALLTVSWRDLATPGVATRYTFIAGIGFVLSLATMAQQRMPRIALPVVAVVLGSLVHGLYRNWTLPLQYQTHFERVAPALARGEAVRVEITPPGWYVDLKARDQDQRPPLPY